MTEIVINRCPNGAPFSQAGLIEFARRKGLDLAPAPDSIGRDDPDLIAMMKEDYGKRIWAGECSHIEVIEIPDGIVWKIDRDGHFEWVSAGG